MIKRLPLQESLWPQNPKMFLTRQHWTPGLLFFSWDTCSWKGQFERTRSSKVKSYTFQLKTFKLLVFPTAFSNYTCPILCIWFKYKTPVGVMTVTMAVPIWDELGWSFRGLFRLFMASRGLNSDWDQKYFILIRHIESL